VDRGRDAVGVGLEAQLLLMSLGLLMRDPRPGQSVYRFDWTPSYNPTQSCPGSIAIGFEVGDLSRQQSGNSSEFF
jgi:hypothetical protein